MTALVIVGVLIDLVWWSWMVFSVGKEYGRKIELDLEAERLKARSKEIADRYRRTRQ
jgi:hypothetical protein